MCQFLYPRILCNSLLLLECWEYPKNRLRLLKQECFFPAKTFTVIT